MLMILDIMVNQIAEKNIWLNCSYIAPSCCQVLDAVLGHNEVLFRRAQLKALVSIHGQEVIHLNHQLHFVQPSIQVE